MLVKVIKIFLKKKKQEYGRKPCKNLSEDTKERFAEYRENYSKKWKNTLQQWRHKPSFITIVCYIYIFLPILKIANTHFTFV